MPQLLSWGQAVTRQIRMPQPLCPIKLIKEDGFLRVELHFNIDYGEPDFRIASLEHEFLIQGLLSCWIADEDTVPTQRNHISVASMTPVPIFTNENGVVYYGNDNALVINCLWRNTLSEMIFIKGESVQILQKPVVNKLFFGDGEIEMHGIYKET